VSACSLLGIAYTRLIRSSSSAAAIVQPPYLVLQFISGVFLQYSQVPPFLKVIAATFREVDGPGPALRLPPRLGGGG